ncbi:MAG: flagellar basal body-associated FliL family protein [Lachnospiraceae bacterium]|nr:flagellar basal body-associated FliL family protein [Lachnospiraceae bacterium]
MKKNLISVIILALLIVNIVLTAIMMFSVTGASKKTAALVDDIATVLDLELASKEGQPAVAMTDTETYSIDSMTVPLKKSEGEDKDHYCVVSITLSINTKAEGYKEYGSAESLAATEGLIKDEVNGVFAQYTLEEARDNQEQIKKEILERVQRMFDSRFIYNVSFSDIMFG